MKLFENSVKKQLCYMIVEWCGVTIIVTFKCELTPLTIKMISDHIAIIFWGEKNNLAAVKIILS